MEGLDGLHVLPLSHEVVSVWRLVFWVAAVLVGGQLLSDVIGRGGLKSTRLIRLAALLMIARFAVVQALRWDQPAFWEGLPVETVALVCAGASCWYYRSPREDAIRGASGVPRRDATTSRATQPRRGGRR